MNSSDFKRTENSLVQTGRNTSRSCGQDGRVSDRMSDRMLETVFHSFR